MRNNIFIITIALLLHSIAVHVRAGSLVSWGADYDGVVSNTPTDNDFVAIAAGADLSIALKSDGSLVAWGDNDYGQVSNTPSGNDFIAVTAGCGHNVALKSNGGLVAWGHDGSGQVSDTPGGHGFTAISAGDGHNVALKSDGSLVSWGWDLYDQVSETPTGNNFIAVGAGDTFSVALQSNGSLVSWGFLPSEVPTGNDFVAISVGGMHSVALKSDGSLISWGWDGFDQVSDTPSGNDFIKISAGHDHSVALKSNGSLVAWGYDYGGLIDTPTGYSFTAIAAGWDHNVAIFREPVLFVVIPGINDEGLEMIDVARALSDSPGFAITIPELANPSDDEVRDLIITNAKVAREYGTDLIINIDMNLEEYDWEFAVPGEFNRWKPATRWAGHKANVVSEAFREVFPEGRRILFAHSAGGDATYKSIKDSHRERMYDDINILNGRTNAGKLLRSLGTCGYDWSQVKIFTSQADLPAAPPVPLLKKILKWFDWLYGSISNKDAASDLARHGAWVHVHFNKVWINGDPVVPEHSTLRDHFNVDADFEVYTATLNGQESCGSLIDVIKETDWISWSGTGNCPQNLTYISEITDMTLYDWSKTDTFIAPEDFQDSLSTYIFDDPVITEELVTESDEGEQPLDNNEDKIIYKEWNQTEETIVFMLFEADELIRNLGLEDFNNEESAFDLACVIDDVFTMLDEGMYFESLIFIENDILQRMDGCANTGHPDEDDWITSIEGQALLYPLVTDTIELIESML